MLGGGGGGQIRDVPQATLPPEPLHTVVVDQGRGQAVLESRGGSVRVVQMVSTTQAALPPEPLHTVVVVATPGGAHVVELSGGKAVVVLPPPVSSVCLGSSGSQ